MAALALGAVPWAAAAPASVVTPVDVPLAATAEAAPGPTPGVVRRQTVLVDVDALAAGRAGDLFALDLFPDVGVKARVDRSARTGSGRYLQGRVSGDGDMSLVLHGTVAVGKIQAGGHSYSLRPALPGTLGASGGRDIPGRRLHIVERLDPAALPPPAPPVPMPEGMAGANRATSAPPGRPATGDGTIDVMVVYEAEGTEALYGGESGVRAFIDLLVAETNLALEESGATARIRLAHRQAVAYRPSAAMGEDLDRLRDPGDGHLDQAHALRDQHAADLVHLLVARASDSCGVAYLLTADVPEAERYGFSVSAAVCNAYGHTFAHEVGHNMGLHHDRYVAGQNRNLLFRYAYGYVNQAAFRPDATAARRWRTIMAYSSQCSANGVGCRLLRRFSNPDLSYADDPMGVDRDAEDRDREGGPADARRVINRTHRRLAGFRTRSCRAAEVVPSARYVPLAGGRAVFLVQATPGCVWQAEAASPWLSISGAVTASGTRVLAVDVPAAAGEREGELVVSDAATGKAVLVRQVESVPAGGVCGRSPLVRDAIVRAAGFDVDGRNCSRVTTAHLAAIGDLDLGGRGIEALAAGDLAGLTGLRTVDLTDNRLASLSADTFADLRNLERLDLAGNSLQRLPPGVFAGLGRLATLDLSGNELAALPADAFAGLASLAALSLRSNHLESLAVGAFSGLGGLTSLSLAWNRLSSLPAGVFADTTRLGELQLNNNVLTSLDGATFHGLAALSHLTLKRNLLSELPGSLFSGLANLRRLRLFRNRLSGLPAGALAGLGRLEQLLLHDNRGVALPVSIVRDGEALKASIPVGAPFPLDLELGGENVRFSDRAGRSLGSVAIPTGSTESAPFNATRPAAAAGPSSVDILLPDLPTSVDQRGSRNHYGYTLAKTGLPLLLTPGVVVSADRLRLGEGSVASYSLRLATRPNGPVRVAATSDNEDVTLATDEAAPAASTSLFFDVDGPRRWDVTQTIRVHAAVDADRHGDTARIRHAVDGYAAPTPTVEVTVSEWPHVLSARIEQPPGQFGTFAAGETIAVAVTLAVPAVVAGAPRFALRIGGRTRMADYHSCSDSCRRLSFRYVVQSTDRAARFIAAGTDAVVLGDGAISDTGGRPLDMRLPTALHAAYRVDGSGERLARPAVDRVVGASAPVDGKTFRRGEEVRILVRFDRPVTVAGRPALALTVGRQARLALYSPEASRLHCLATRRRPPWPQCDSLVFVYIVAADDFDDDGIAVRAAALLANRGAVAGADAPARLDIRDATFEVADNLLVDGGSEPPPSVVDAIVQSKPRSEGGYGAGESIDVLIAFSDAVSVVGTARLALAVGPRTVHAEQAACGRYATDRPLSCRFLGFRHVVQPVDADADGISIVDGALTSADTVALGADGRKALLGLASHSIADAGDHRVDGGLDTPPRVVGLHVLSTPAAAADTYGAGERVVVGVAFDQPVAVVGAPGLRLTIGAGTRLAAHLDVDSAEWPAPAWPAAAAFSAADTLLWTPSKDDGAGGVAPPGKVRSATARERSAAARHRARLAFAYEVQARDADPDGIGVAADALTLNGGVIHDGSGQAAVPDLAALSFSVAGSHKIDGSLRANQPPFVSTPIDEVVLRPGAAMRIDAARHFEDPDGDTLAYAARSRDSGVASVAASGSSVDLVAHAPGATVVVLTAADAQAQAAQTAFLLTVPGPLGAPPPGALPALELAVGATAGVVLDRQVGDRLAYRAASTHPEVAVAAIVDGLVHVVAVAPGFAVVQVADPAGTGPGWSLLVAVRATASAAVGDLGIAAGGIAEIDLGGGRASYPATSSHPAVASVAVDGRGRLRVVAKAPGRATVTLGTALRDRGGMAAGRFLATVSKAPVVPPLSAGGETGAIALASLFPAASADTPLAAGTGDRRMVAAAWRDGRLVLRPGELDGRTDVVATALFANGWRASVRLPVSVAPPLRPGMRGWRLALPRLVGEALR